MLRFEPGVTGDGKPAVGEGDVDGRARQGVDVDLPDGGRQLLVGQAGEEAVQHPFEVLIR